MGVRCRTSRRPACWAQAGINIAGGGPQQLTAYLAAEKRKWLPVIHNCSEGASPAFVNLESARSTKWVGVRTAFPDIRQASGSRRCGNLTYRLRLSYVTGNFKKKWLFLSRYLSAV